MSDLIPFDYDGRPVRTVQIDGEPWFVGRDVCAVLDIADARASLNLLDEDERDSIPVIDAMGREQRTIIINEPGLYSLILRSRKPEAKPFKRWITHEVLPAIRKTGSYNATPALPDMSTPEGQLAVAEMLAAGARKQIEQAAEIKALTPKANYVDSFVDALGDATTIRVLANQIGVKEKALREHLVNQKVIYRKIAGSRWSRSQGKQVTEYSWHPYAKYTDWFVARDQPEAPRLHNGQMQTTLYVTPLGKVQVAELVKRTLSEAAS